MYSCILAKKERFPRRWSALRRRLHCMWRALHASAARPAASQTRNRICNNSSTGTNARTKVWVRLQFEPLRHVLCCKRPVRLLPDVPSYHAEHDSLFRLNANDMLTLVPMQAVSFSRMLSHDQSHVSTQSTGTGTHPSRFST
jgi:hypothetical protein